MWGAERGVNGLQTTSGTTIVPIFLPICYVPTFLVIFQPYFYQHCSQYSHQCQQITDNLRHIWFTIVTKFLPIVVSDISTNISTNDNRIQTTSGTAGFQFYQYFFNCTNMVISYRQFQDWLNEFQPINVAHYILFVYFQQYPWNCQQCCFKRLCQENRISDEEDYLKSAE